jgi:chromosome segregation ATPase
MIKNILNFMLKNWKFVCVFAAAGYVSFLGWRVNKLTLENNDLRARIEIEERISAAAETEMTEITDLMHVYYESRFDLLKNAQKQFDEAQRLEDERYNTEIEDLRRRQRRLRDELRALGESDPEALTCEFAKKFNLQGCVK